MDSASARETLLGFSPPPTGTAAADNRLLEPECDLQIVIPAYNVEAYLAQCMDSVLAQETKYTYRVNLVDDEGDPIFAPGATAPVTDADDNPLFNLTVMGGHSGDSDQGQPRSDEGPDLPVRPEAV